MLSFEDWREFQTYLRILAKSNKKKPFDCPFLAVLPENIFYRLSDAWRFEYYSAGSLFCSERTGLCATKGGQSALVLNEHAEVMIPCNYNGSELKFSLTGFVALK